MEMISRSGDAQRYREARRRSKAWGTVRIADESQNQHLNTENTENGHRVHRENLEFTVLFPTDLGQGDAEGAESATPRLGFYRSGKLKRRPKRAVMGRPSSGPPLRENR